MKQAAVALTLGMIALIAVAGTAQSRNASFLFAWNQPQAVSYLTSRTTSWLKWGGSARGAGTACISCHTGLPLSLSLAALSAKNSLNKAGEAEALLITDVKARVRGWRTITSASAAQGDSPQCYYGDKRPSSLGTESVMNALVLADYDQSHGRIAPGNYTRTALNYMWQQQQPDGSWLWLEFGLSPWEHDGTYYGASLAAMAAGMAGPTYLHAPNVQHHIAILRRYLQEGFEKARLHDATVCLLASTWLPKLLTRTEQLQVVKRLEGVQNTDGGWSLHSLGTVGTQPSQWSNPGTYPPNSNSDGYATGLVVLALERLRAPGTSLVVSRGVYWLINHEVNGSWPADYINGPRDPHTMEGHFMRDAATAFAVLALQQY